MIVAQVRLENSDNDTLELIIMSLEELKAKNIEFEKLGYTDHGKNFRIDF